MTMKYELRTLDEYSGEAILTELRRVADGLNGQRLTRELFDSVARVHSSTVGRRFGSWGGALDRAEISAEIAPRYRVLSRQDVIQALQKFAAEYPNSPVTLEAIAERLSVDKATISGKFGKWRTLLSEVGIPSVPMGRRYAEEECFENILALWTHYGRQPHFGELKHPPSTVGPKAYINRWGGWRGALSAFVKSVDDTSVAGFEPDAAEPKIEKPDDSRAESPAPRSIPLGLRYKILTRDRFRCVLCGASPAKGNTSDLHVDHIYPYSLRPQHVEENLRTLCVECNLGKGAKIEVV